jgi:hypothetical protein
MKMKTILFAGAMALAVATGARSETAAQACTDAADGATALAKARDRGVSRKAADDLVDDSAEEPAVKIAMRQTVSTVYDNPQKSAVQLTQIVFDACMAR